MSCAKCRRSSKASCRGAKCELQDYEHRIGCGALDAVGKVRDVRSLRAGLTEEDARSLGQTLAERLAGAST